MPARPTPEWIFIVIKAYSIILDFHFLRRLKIQENTGGGRVSMFYDIIQTFLGNSVKALDLLFCEVFIPHKSECDLQVIFL